MLKQYDIFPKIHSVNKMDEVRELNCAHNSASPCTDKKVMMDCLSKMKQPASRKSGIVWQEYIDRESRHWVPQQIDMTADAMLWKKSHGLLSSERKTILFALGNMSLADQFDVNNLVLEIYNYVDDPDCRLFLLHKAFEESQQIHVYKYCVKYLGIDETKMLNQYRKYPSILYKNGTDDLYTLSINNPSSITIGKEVDTAFLKSLVYYFVVTKGIRHFVDYIRVFALGKFEKMPGVVKQFQYIFRDELVHLHFGLDVIHQLIRANPHIWTESTQYEIAQIILDGEKLENKYALESMACNSTSINPVALQKYLQLVTNERLNQLGLPAQYKEGTHPFPWMNEIMDSLEDSRPSEPWETDNQAGGTFWLRSD